MIELGFYLSLVFSVASDVKRKVSDTGMPPKLCYLHTIKPLRNPPSKEIPHRVPRIMRTIRCVRSVFWGFDIDFPIKTSRLYALYWVELSAFRMPLKVMFNSTHPFVSLVKSEWVEWTELSVQSDVASGGALWVNVWPELCGKSHCGETVSTGLNVVVKGGKPSSPSADCEAPVQLLFYNSNS